jgi:putative spermidine/putrescine transport system permease protein
MNRMMGGFALLIYAALALPVVLVAGASFTAGDYLSVPPQGFSRRWWQAMLDDPDMVLGFVISLRVAAATVAISLPLGALAAIGVARAPGGWRTTLATLLASPLSVPLVLVGFSQLVFLTQLGLMNEIGLILAHVVVSTPYVMRSALASYALMDPFTARAAAIHGAKPWQVIWHVILPALRPGLVSGGLFAGLASLNNIVVSAFLARPGASPLPVVIFSRMENLAEPSVAAASTAVILLTTVVCLVLEKRYSLFATLARR